MALWNVYVGCFTEDLWKYFPRPDRDTAIPSEGIERLLFDDITGSLQTVDTTGGDLFSPQYLEVHPALPVLYAAEFAHPGRLTSFNILPDGRLARQSTIDSLSAMAVTVSIHPTGAFAFVGHLGDGALTACPLGRDGAVLRAERVTPSLAQECASQYHQARVTPKGDSLVVTDYRCDEVVTYTIEEGGMVSSDPVARVDFPVGSSPRHIEFHPSGNLAYVVGEHDARLYVLESHDFVPHKIMTSHSVAPPDYGGNGMPSELHLHPDGVTLFVGVRRPGCITAFAVDEFGGATTLYHEPCLGRSPRAVRVDPAGRHLLVGNWQSNGLAVFAIDDARRLRALGEPVNVHSPSSIVFVPAS